MLTLNPNLMQEENCGGDISNDAARLVHLPVFFSKIVRTRELAISTHHWLNAVLAILALKTPIKP